MEKKRKNTLLLYLSLLGWMMIPTIYTTVRTAVAGSTGSSLDILGSLEWFDLIDETITAFLTVPLYYLLKSKEDRKRNSGAAMLLSLIIYVIFMSVAIANVTSLASFMHQKNAVNYLTAESISIIIGFVGTLAVLMFTLCGMKKAVVILTATKIIGYVIGDVALMPEFGALGSAYSDMLTNLLIGTAGVAIILKTHIVSKPVLNRRLLVSWAEKGLFSGGSIFLDNLIYAVAVVRIMAGAGNAGPYWVANNIIWGFMIPPVSALCEIIKRSRLKKLTLKTASSCLIIGVSWLVFSLFWEPFISGVMMQNVRNTNIIIHLLEILLPFYFAYMISAVLDAFLISQGRTWCQALISVIVNIGYYGVMYLIADIKTLNQVAVMFGLGMAVHAVISAIIYTIIVRKLHMNKIRLTE